MYITEFKQKTKAQMMMEKEKQMKKEWMELQDIVCQDVAH